jgi:ADP-ribosylglycohydrolase
MCGGGGRDPGEATDDTQMAVLVGASLLERRGLDLPDVFNGAVWPCPASAVRALRTTPSYEGAARGAAPCTCRCPDAAGGCCALPHSRARPCG